MREGEVVAGRYRVLHELGRGGMGIVYAAHDEQLGRDVALKVLAEFFHGDPVAVLRFRREARALAAVKHPGVVAVYDVGEVGGRSFLVMDLIEGIDLQKRLSGHRRLSPMRTGELVQGVASALDALHRAGLVHRDVKPSNICLEGEHQRPVLGDFGLAKPLGLDDGLTSTGETVGTVQYMSPEQLSGDPLTPACDVYALGCVAFHCLTGHPPFGGADPYEVASGHRADPVPDICVLVLSLPRAVQPVLERMLAKRPEQRWPTAGQAAAALTAALGVGRPEDSAHPSADVHGRTAVHRDPRADSGSTRMFASSPHTLHADPAPASFAAAARGRPRTRTRTVRLVLAACAAVVLGGVLLVGALGALGDPPPGGTETGTSAATVLDGDHQALADLLGEGFGECTPLERLPGQRAKLNCDQTPDGIATLHAVQWQDQGWMDIDFRNRYVDAGRYEFAPCRDFLGGPEAAGTGRLSSWPGVGSIACYVNSNAHAVLLWQVDERAVTLLAIRDDADSPALFAWWQDARQGVLRPVR